jgi:hypothetical protein
MLYYTHVYNSLLSTLYHFLNKPLQYNFRPIIFYRKSTYAVGTQVFVLRTLKFSDDPPQCNGHQREDCNAKLAKTLDTWNRWGCAFVVVKSVAVRIRGDTIPPRMVLAECSLRVFAHYIVPERQ